VPNPPFNGLTAASAKLWIALLPPAGLRETGNHKDQRRRSARGGSVKVKRDVRQSARFEKDEPNPRRKTMPNGWERDGPNEARRTTLKKSQRP